MMSTTDSWVSLNNSLALKDRGLVAGFEETFILGDFVGAGIPSTVRSSRVRGFSVLSELTFAGVDDWVGSSGSLDFFFDRDGGSKSRMELLNFLFSGEIISFLGSLSLQY